VADRPGSFHALLARGSGGPGQVLRQARTQKLRAFMLITEALPSQIRRVLFAPLGASTAALLRRNGDHAIAGPIQAIATDATDGRRAAVARAEALATGGSVRATVRYARVALAAGDPAAADRILGGVPTTIVDPTIDILRAEIAYQLGRFATTVALVGPLATARPRDDQVRRLVTRSRAELALMDPSWRPNLGAQASVATTLADPIRGRILHLLTNSLPQRQAGYTVRAQSVARAQLGQGLDPQMVTRAGFPRSEGVSGAASRDIVDGIPYHRLRPDLPTGLPVDRIATETARALAPLISTLRPALLQPTTNYLNAQVALALGERFGLPVVYEVRGFLEETWLSRVGDAAEAGDRYHAARAIETECMRRAAAIVTLSETMRTEILERGGIDPTGVTVIPNAVEVERFRPGPPAPELLASLGIKAGTPVVGYISSLTGYEGIGYLIEAVGLLRDRGRTVRLVLVGDGEARADLEATARAVGVLDGTVVFTGRVPHREIERYYRTIDVFVVPRTRDRVSQLVTPLKPYEAMAMAKALVVSDVGALLEIVTDGRTGRTFTAEDPVNLADILEPLLDDPVERARLGAAARTWVAEHRTWEINGRRYLELYQRLGVA